MPVLTITNLDEPALPIVPASAPTAISSGVVTDLAQLASLAQAWDAIEQGFPSPMQHSDWSLACMDVLRHRGQPRALVEAADGKLCGIAPLVIDRLVWPPRAVLAGVADLQEPMDLIYKDQASLERLVQRLVDLRMPLSLERIPAESPALPVLRRAFAGRGMVVERSRACFPYINLSPAWHDPAGQLSSRRRSDLRRAWKRAEAFGEVTCEVMTPPLEKLDELFEAALEVEGRSWKGEAGTALIHDPIRSSFYRQYAHAACRRGTLRFCWLRFGSATVAVQFAIEESQRLWLLKIGYDEQYARCSPGNLLICETLRYAAQKGLVSYEFLGSSDDWTRVWTRDERHTVCVRIYPYNVAGMVAFAQQSLDQVKKRWSRPKF
jgi:CelD/BcsL family acetyltransferase involved in cellulose biosynthesis